MYGFDNNNYFEDFNVRVFPQWSNYSDTNNTFSWEANLPGNEPVTPGQPHYFRAFIDEAEVVGHQQIWIQGKSAIGEYTPVTNNTWITIPITLSTTASNGASVAALIGSGFTATNTMAYFESSSLINSDSDIQLDWQEYITGTSPTNSASHFRTTITNTVPPTINWNWASNRHYSVSISTNLSDGFSVLTNGLTSSEYVDTINRPYGFYRVDVALP